MCWQERPFLRNPKNEVTANCTYLIIYFNSLQYVNMEEVYDSQSEQAKEEYRKAIELDLKVSRETIARPDIQVCGSIGQDTCPARPLRGVVLRHHN